jgi:hypothetical protein
MKKLQEARKKLDDLKQKLADLNGQADTIRQQVECLQAERQRAVVAMARGDDKQQSVINALEAKIKDISLKLEGINGIVDETRGEFDQATATAADLQVDFDAKRNLWVQEQFAKLSESICDQAPVRVDRIKQLFLDLCMELGGLLLDKHLEETIFREVLGSPVKNKVIEDYLQTIILFLNDEIKKSPSKPTSCLGYVGNITAFPMIQPIFPGAQVVNPVNEAKIILDRQKAELSSQYKEN